jgi:hypothetical protein
MEYRRYLILIMFAVTDTAPCTSFHIKGLFFTTERKANRLAYFQENF